MKSSLVVLILVSLSVIAHATPLVRRSTCGDGVVDGGEECDDGNGNDLDTCTNTCKRNCVLKGTPAFGPLSHYNVFVSGDMTAASSDVHGFLAVGGKADLSNYGIGQGEPPHKCDERSEDNAALVVGGAYSGASVNIKGGDVYVGSGSISGTTVYDTCEFFAGNANGFFDFGAATSFVEGISSGMFNWVANGNTEFKYGGLYLDCQGQKECVLEVKASDVQSAHGIQVNGVPADLKILVVNIKGNQVNFSNMGFGGQFHQFKSKVLFNFRGNKLTASGVGVPGTVMAPNALLGSSTGANIEGHVFVKSWNSKMQANINHFNGCIPGEPEPEDKDEPICGNGITEGVEQCDDGNGNNNDDCKNDCTANVCGDGIVNDGVEQCDDGNSNNSDDCKNDCTPNVCGDGIVNVGVEQCDDGNSVNTDGCKNDCTSNICGDGVIYVGVEECDEGLNNGAKCTDECELSKECDWNSEDRRRSLGDDPLGTDPFGVLSNFNIFAAGNFESVSSDSSGPVAVRGNMKVKNYGINQGEQVDQCDAREFQGLWNSALLVKGSMTASSLNVRAGDIYLQNVSQNSGITKSNTCEVKGNPSSIIDFNSSKASLQTAANALLGLADFQTSVSGNSNDIKVQCSGSALELCVASLTDSQISNAKGITLSGSVNAGGVVIKVVGANPKFENMGFNGDFQSVPNKIIWVSATNNDVYVDGVGLKGSVLFPWATIRGSSGAHIQGHAFVKNWINNVQLNLGPYDGCLPTWVLNLFNGTILNKQSLTT